jgi:hypothetical protein
MGASRTPYSAPRDQQPAWQLIIYMTDRKAERAVEILFHDEALLKRQLRQLDLQKPHDPFALFDFTNEIGETLAVVAQFVSRYEVVKLSV